MQFADLSVMIQFAHLHWLHSFNNISVALKVAPVEHWNYQTEVSNFNLKITHSMVPYQSGCLLIHGVLYYSIPVHPITKLVTPGVYCE